MEEFSLVTEPAYARRNALLRVLADASRQQCSSQLKAIPSMTRGHKSPHSRRAIIQACEVRYTRLSDKLVMCGARYEP